MKLKPLILSLAVATMANTAIATQPLINSNLSELREHIVQQYITDLGNADYQDITNLFEKNGVVVSTSRGEVNAKDFFYAFLPSVQSATIQQKQLFSGLTDANRFAARFHFTFKFKDGETGEGEYIDEFVFTENSPMLSAVYMFENTKFSNPTEK